MPEYLAPGVYVEEVFGTKSIEGVSTSTTAFVGPTIKGPIYVPNAVTNLPPELVTSFGDFERIYGGLGDLTLGGAAARNYLALAVAAYFNNGGSRLYVSRTFVAAGDADTGLAGSTPLGGDAADSQVTFVARTPGSAGNGRIRVSASAELASARTMTTAPIGSFLRVPGAGDADPTLFVKGAGGWADDADAAPAGDVAAGTAIITINVEAQDAAGNPTAFEGLGFDPRHPRYIGSVLAAAPSNRRDALEHTYAVTVGADVTPFNLYDAFFGDADTRTVDLTGGNDGGIPGAEAYAAALEPIAKLDEVSIVAAPGYSTFADEAAGIRNALVSHGDADRSYRIVVLDTPAGQTGSQAQEFRSQIDSSHTALYYPWVWTPNPLARQGDASRPREILQPPSGFVCGIYARNDVQRGVHKAPANEVVRGALRFETDVSMGEQAVLNPRGINCLRFFELRGYRVWGARTASSDPEWKYVNIRRYFNYLERSIDRGTQWAVFEPNGERLWGNVRQTISDFLYNEWVSGALLGGTPKEAFFVRCDRSTMTQNDLDNGRLICLIGVAALKPAEFVIFRIGQKTADARS